MVSRKRSTKEALEADGSRTTRTPPSVLTVVMRPFISLSIVDARPPNVTTREQSSTFDGLPSSRVVLQRAEQNFRLVRAVYTRLDHLLQHRVHWTWSKVVWQMLHLLPVQVRTTVSMLIHVHTH